MSNILYKLSCGYGCVYGSPKGMAPNVACECLYELPPNKRVKVNRALKLLRERIKELELFIEET